MPFWTRAALATAVSAGLGLTTFGPTATAQTSAQSAAETAAQVVGLTGTRIPGVRPVNTYGVPGLIDMPTAQMQPDAELTTSLTLLSNDSGRVQLAFQVTPRLQALFRYSTLPDFLPVGDDFARTYDRSFDLRYQLLTEGARRPAVTVGIQDIGGTSLYAAEYLVATKSFLDGRLTATAGIGWGRLGTRGGFSNPLGALSDRFDTRPDLDFGRGGSVSTDQLFRGDAALFGGVQYQVGERLTLAAEYSSDAYEEEELRGIIDTKTPLNFAATYRLRDGIALTGYVLHGAEVGMALQFDVNPRRSPTGSGTEGLAPPMTVRPSRAEAPALWTTSWPGDAQVEPAVRAALAAALDEQGIELVATRLEATRAEIRYRNRRWGVDAQALGRVARVASGIVPASVETFTLVPVTEDGVPGAAAIVRRSDLEALENRPDGAGEIAAVTGFVDAARLPGEGLVREEDAFPRFRWSLGPSIELGYFDPDAPVRYDVGATLGASWQPVPGLRFEGALRQSLGGTLDDVTRETGSFLPRVRTDSPEFARADGVVVTHLTGDYLFRAGPALYGRVSAGLLERQFGGVSTEVLFKPVGSPFAIGAELNRVRQRDFDGGFGFRDLQATTAFVSGYLQHGNGFLSQLDVGQYLAGDRGATYTLTREFENGWRVGAFATKTNISSEEFGEGSFDKGIRLQIPLSWVTGEPSRSRGGVTLRPVQRDGGARLGLRNRLYPEVQDLSPPDLEDGWGRFWR